MNNSLRKAAAKITDAEKEDILDRMEATIGLAIEEMQNSRGAARRRAAETVRMLKSMERFKELRERTITPQESKEIITALHEASTAYADLKENNAKSRGKDGLTMTERERDQKAEILNKERVLQLLRDIKEEQVAQKEAKQAETKTLRATLRDGFAGFLGPIGPLYLTLHELKEQYGDDAKRISHKMADILGLKRDEFKEFGIQSEKQTRRDSKLFSMLNHQLRRMTGMLGRKGLTGIDALDDLLDRIGGGGKARGRGRGGMFTRLKRGLRKIPGVKGLMRRAGKNPIGRALGRGARGLSGFLGKSLGLAGRALPFIGAGLGAMDLLETARNGGERGKNGEGAITDYASGALSGASIGAVFGGPIGAAIGAVVGLAFTGIVRNWSTMRDGIRQSWEKVTGSISERWAQIKQFGANFLTDVQSVWDNIQDRMYAVLKWFKDTVPDFEEVKRKSRAVIGQTANRVQNTAANVAGTVAGAAQSVAQAAPSTIQSVGRSIAGDTGASIGAKVGSVVGRAAEGVSNFVSKISMPSTEIKSAITDAADKIGVDKGYMLAKAGQESSFNPAAGANGSSAKGLYMFTDSTWTEMVKKYGAQYNITQKDIYDPKKNALMGALFTRDNAQILQQTGVASGPTELYATHVLGQSGGPRFLQAVQNNPKGNAAQANPAAAKANPKIFYDMFGRPRTNEEVYAWFRDRVGNKAAAYSKALGEQQTATKTDVASSTKQAIANSVKDTKDTEAENVATAAPVSVAINQGAMQNFADVDSTANTMNNVNNVNTATGSKLFSSDVNTTNSKSEEANVTALGDSFTTNNFLPQSSTPISGPASGLPKTNVDMTFAQVLAKGMPEVFKRLTDTSTMLKLPPEIMNRSVMDVAREKLGSKPSSRGENARSRMQEVLDKVQSVGNISSSSTSNTSTNTNVSETILKNLGIHIPDSIQSVVSSVANTGTRMSVAPTTEPYNQVRSARPTANVRVQPQLPAPALQGAGIGTSVSGVQKSVQDIPMVLGDPPYIVINSNMVGA